MKYNAYLLELPLDEGITSAQMHALLSNAGADETFFPVSVEAEHSWAFGILTHEAADAVYNFDPEPFAAAVRPYLEDEEKVKPFYRGGDAISFDLGDIQVHLYRYAATPSPKDAYHLSLEAAEQKYGFYGCVDENNTPHTYVLLNLPRVIKSDLCHPGHIGKCASYAVPITEDEKPTPCGPTVLLVWDDAEGFAVGKDPAITSLSNNTVILAEEDMDPRTGTESASGTWFGVTRWAVEDVIQAAMANGIKLTEEQAVKWWRQNESAFSNLMVAYGNEVLSEMDFNF